jgi:hypothetical protein
LLRISSRIACKLYSREEFSSPSVMMIVMTLS